MLDVLLTNTDGLPGKAKIGSILSYSDHALVELMISRGTD